MANIVLGFVVQHFGWHIGCVINSHQHTRYVMFHFNLNKRGQETNRLVS